MGSKSTKEEMKTESGPLRNSPNEQKKNSDSQNLSYNLVTEQQRRDSAHPSSATTQQKTGYYEKLSNLAPKSNNLSCNSVAEQLGQQQSANLKSVQRSDTGQLSNNAATVKTSDTGQLSNNAATVKRTDTGQLSNNAATVKRTDTGQLSNNAATVKRTDTGQLSNNPATVEASDTEQPRNNPGTVKRRVTRQPRINPGTVKRSVTQQPRINPATVKRSVTQQPRINPATVKRSVTQQPRINPATVKRSVTQQPRINPATVKRSVTGQPNIEPPAEKFYDFQDFTLHFVDGDDDMDFECNEFKSLRAKMSCGHTVTPMSLTIWCRHQLDKGKGRFVCGHCKAEWPYEEVRKMALLTPEEMEYFEKKMYDYAAKNYLDVKSCPGCKSAVVRTDLNNLQVYCISCTARQNKAFTFCWQCLNEWKGPAPRSGHCENDECHSPLEILRTCPEIRFKVVKGVTGCPSTRACPTCGLLVEHDGTRCKHITCSRCKVKFCLVCLKLTVECEKVGNNSLIKVCSTGVAPRQTSIPVWNRK
ncbi:E3 ubiquitin-protein ligase RNF19B-like [Centropristis striata]|uniref:E3 ubiquitin-protein ligase RNF19B-like n=1 Tax=Centropristis striata TaxID=184440 RepID=UPI0027E1469F|nr:E3 ubiquitin-protein ligase RNF19B-like [Centropristis striata]